MRKYPCDEKEGVGLRDLIDNAIEEYGFFQAFVSLEFESHGHGKGVDHKEDEESGSDALLGRGS